MALKKAISKTEFMYLVIDKYYYNKAENAIYYTNSIFRTNTKEYELYKNSLENKATYKELVSQLEKKRQIDLNKATEKELKEIESLENGIKVLKELIKPFEDVTRLFPILLQRNEDRLILSEKISNLDDSVSLIYSSIKNNPLFSDWEDC